MSPSRWFLISVPEGVVIMRAAFLPGHEPTDVGGPMSRIVGQKIVDEWNELADSVDALEKTQCHACIGGCCDACCDSPLNRGKAEPQAAAK